VLANISTDIHITQAVNLIADSDVPGSKYWRRRAEDHFPGVDVFSHGGSWKRLCCEKTLENAVSSWTAEADTVPLAQLAKALCSCVYRLQLDQLLPNTSQNGGIPRKVTDPPPDHLDLEVLVAVCDNLTHVSLYYGYSSLLCAL
jgi:hypothetical protein